MGNHPSPIESLAAYGIAFVSGAIFLTLVAAYGQLMRRRGAREVETQFEVSRDTLGH